MSVLLLNVLGGGAMVGEVVGEAVGKAVGEPVGGPEGVGGVTPE